MATQNFKIKHGLNLGEHELIDALGNINLPVGAVINVGGAPLDALPDQSGQSGKFLSTNGSIASWSAITQYTPPTNQGTGNFLSGDGTYKPVTLPTLVSQLTNDADYQTASQVNASLAALVDAAPSTLNTLNELAAALGDDPNFATTISGQIGAKWTQDNTKIANWDAAYSWGNHANFNYATLDNVNQGLASRAELSGATFTGAVSATSFSGNGAGLTNLNWSNISNVPSSIVRRNAYTAQAGDTVFAATYTVGSVEVYINGMHLMSGTDYTATNGTSITLTDPALAGDEIEIVSFSTFSIANVYTQAETSALIANSITSKWTQDNTKISNWDTAYSWGNHASAGYATQTYVTTAISTKADTASPTFTGTVTATTLSSKVQPSTSKEGIQWTDSSGTKLFGLSVYGSADTYSPSLVWNSGNPVGNFTGSGSVVIGGWAAPNASGSQNALYGYGAGYGLTSGNYNTFIGASAGYSNTGSGNQNTFLGAGTAPAGANQSNQTVIGYGTTGNGSNTVTIGNASVTDTYLKGIIHGNGSGLTNIPSDATKANLTGATFTGTVSATTIQTPTIQNTTPGNGLTINENVGIKDQYPLQNVLGVENTWMSPVLTIKGNRPTLFLKGDNTSSLATIRINPGANDIANLTEIDDWHINVSKSSDTVGTGGNFAISPRGGSLGSAIKITNNGYVTNPLKPSFQYSASTNQEPASAQIIVYDSLGKNVGNSYVPSSSKFTAPVAGWYEFTWRYWFRQGATGTINCEILKNGIGVQQHRVPRPTAQGDFETIIRTARLYLEQYDYVQPSANGGAGTCFHSSTGSYYSEWSGILLG